MNNFAPVLIPTLNRHVHFKRCVESLSACTHADKTDLYIFLDYPLKDNHWDGYEHIKACLPNIKGFKTVNIIEREKNYGVVDNTFRSMEYLFERYDKLIYSEDDNEFSPNFLVYINKGLNEFVHDPSVFAVCGYNYPMKIPIKYINNHYFVQGFSAWGFGMWKTKYESLDLSIANLKKFLRNPLNIIKLKNKQYDLLIGLINVVKSGNVYGDRMFCYNNIIKGTYSVFPLISKVRNHGHDDSGSHCTRMLNDIFSSQVIDDQETFDYDINVEKENTIINKALRNHINDFTKNSFKKKFKSLIKYLLFLMNNRWY